ncbi:MAG: FAD-dependent oxidoreductase [Verrucomicrobiota bacterium]|nr:FAD-dependent oxidoreductase [Verrucomicrobiota bacterium]
MMENEYDAVVVGCGIAGALLSWRLIQRGQRVLVYDPGESTSASRVAPGIINPLAGKRLHPAWRIAELLPEAIATYRELEQDLGGSYYHPLPIVRILQNEFERTVLAQRASQPEAQPYIGWRRDAGWMPGLVHDPLGSFAAEGSGWVDLNALLAGWRGRLRTMGCLRDEALNHKALQPGAQGVRGPGWSAKRVVFCEGWSVRYNPWFADLPFKPAKGEMLELETQTELPPVILNSGKWLLPLGNGRCRAGATFEWGPLDTVPTETARHEILDVLAKFLRADFRVISAQAGVRPILRDYRAVLGCHPVHPQFCIFNGLGSKGALAAPWLSRRLAEYLLDATTLDREFSLNRFAQ